MSNILLTIFNMSVTAGWLAVAVMILRPILRKAPKYITCALWALVGIRLMCPFSFQSALSLIPSATPVIVAPEPIINNSPPLTVSPGIPVNDPVTQVSYGSSVVLPSTADGYLSVLAIVWLAGIAAMLIYMIISYLRVYLQVREAAPVNGRVWECDRVQSPFILGLVRPRIFLPSTMEKTDADYVVAHEQAHLRRLDHLWKPLGFVLLAIHWFNPLMWVAYILLCRDIELACDEKVIKKLGADIKKDYSNALINCSVPRKMITACPLAFGEVGVKQRIKSVLSYKKPAFWVVLIAVILLIATAICFLTNPLAPRDLDDYLSHIIKFQHRTLDDGNYRQFEAHTILGTSGHGDTIDVYAMVYYIEYRLDDNARLIDTRSGSHIPTVITLTKHDGEYTLLDYRIPQDGALYPASIKQLFPWYLRPLTNTQLYIKRHQKEFRQHLDDVYELNHLPEDTMAADAVPTAISTAYFCAESPDEVKPWFMLTPATGEFRLSITGLYYFFDTGNYEIIDTKLVLQDPDGKYDDYFHKGSYETTDGTLVLHTSDGKYDFYFTAKDGGWCFDAHRSSELPRYHYSSNTDSTQASFEHGAMFYEEYTTSDPQLGNHFDETAFDLDKSGSTNICTIGHGMTSGIFSFTVTVWDDSNQKVLCNAAFYPASWYNKLNFTTTNGKLYVCGVDNNGDPHKWEVRIDDGYLVLSENGVWLSDSGAPISPTVTQQLSSFFQRYSYYSAEAIVISDYFQLQEVYEYIMSDDSKYYLSLRYNDSAVYNDYLNGTYSPKFFRSNYLVAVAIHSPSSSDNFGVSVTPDDTRLRAEAVQTQSDDRPTDDGGYFIYLIPISGSYNNQAIYSVITPKIN